MWCVSTENRVVQELECAQEEGEENKILLLPHCDCFVKGTMMMIIVMVVNTNSNSNSIMKRETTITITTTITMKQ